MQDTINVKIKFLNERAKGYYKEGTPAYKTLGSAAVDLHVDLDEEFILKPGEVQLVNTGLAIFVEDPNYAGVLLPRSGTGHKEGLVLGNGTGLMDSDYQGEVLISMFNRSSEPRLIKPGERLAQYAFVRIAQARFEVVDDFATSDRGEGGFGHTGKE